MVHFSIFQFSPIKLQSNRKSSKSFNVFSDWVSIALNVWKRKTEYPSLSTCGWICWIRLRACSNQSLIQLICRCLCGCHLTLHKSICFKCSFCSKFQYVFSTMHLKYKSVMVKTDQMPYFSLILLQKYMYMSLVLIVCKFLYWLYLLFIYVSSEFGWVWKCT